MPNCDFYGTSTDHEQLLTWLFVESTCRCFELSSSYEQDLAEFFSADEVMAQFTRTYPSGEPWHTVHLQLYVLGAGPDFRAKRVQLDPEYCNGATFRYAAEGAGLVQLYLSVPREDGLENSHTNHNSLKRAQKWCLSSEVSQWDFKAITSFSSKLNRKVRGMSVAKAGSRPVLPGAYALHLEGCNLRPYGPEDVQLMPPGPNKSLERTPLSFDVRSESRQWKS